MAEKKIGIAGYGCYIPLHRIKVEEIAKVWNQDPNNIKKSLTVEEKSIANADEDTITLAVEAGKNAFLSGIDPSKVGALFIGSESHPYVVKPSGTVVAEALGLPKQLMLADFEFACKAGTAAIQVCSALVRAGDIEYGLAIGSDCAQSRPGDALEYTAAAGAAAFIIGKNPLAEIEGTFSYTTDTPDFWRREGQPYPSHGARFTGKPAYFHHVIEATNGLMEKLSLKKEDFDYVVFHMPNGKFPREACKAMGFDMNKLIPSLVVEKVGNSYSASSLMGLCKILDLAKPGERILLTSFGSGAGSDSFSFLVTDVIKERRFGRVDYYINNKKYVDYGTYVKMRGKLRL